MIPEARDLYGLPPDEFIGARDAMASGLKDDGRPEDAAAVKKLRKPSLVAWALNVTSRDRPEDVEALLEAGAELRRAQRKTLSGGGAQELRRATEARRALIQRLADGAVAAIGDRGAAHRDAILGTLDAASVDGDLGERLRAGTLEKEARPTAGFGAIEGFEVLLGGGGEEPDEPAASPLEEARERAREARAASQRAAAAERAAEKAAGRAEDLKRKAAAVLAAAREAESEAKRLTDEARTERKRADRAMRASERP